MTWNFMSDAINSLAGQSSFDQISGGAPSSGGGMFDSVLNDPLISGANAASGNDAEPVANIASQSGGSWMKNLLGGIFIGMAGGANAENPGQAFAQGAAAVFQKRQQDIDNIRKDKEQKRLQDLTDIQTTQLRMATLKDKMDILAYPGKYSAEVQKSINEQEMSIYKTHQEMGNPQLGEFKTKEAAAEYLAKSNGAYGLHNTEDATIIDPRTGETTIYLFKDMQQQYPQGTMHTFSDGNTVDKSTLGTMVQANKYVTEYNNKLADAERKQAAELEQIGATQAGALKVANVYASRTTAGSAANGPNALDDDMIRHKQGLLSEVNKFLLTPPQIGWTKDQQAAWQQQMEQAKIEKGNYIREINDIYSQRKGLTNGSTGGAWRVENGQVIDPSGRAVPIGTDVPNKGKVIGVKPDGSDALFESVGGGPMPFPQPAFEAAGQSYANPDYTQRFDPSGIGENIGFNTQSTLPDAATFVRSATVGTGFGIRGGQSRILTPEQIIQRAFSEHGQEFAQQVAAILNGQ